MTAYHYLQEKKEWKRIQGTLLQAVDPAFRNELGLPLVDVSEVYRINTWNCLKQFTFSLRRVCPTTQSEVFSASKLGEEPVIHFYWTVNFYPLNIFLLTKNINIVQNTRQLSSMMLNEALVLHNLIRLML